MTNKEYITKSLSGLNVPGDDVDIIIADAGLNPDSVATPVECKRAIYGRMSVVLKSATQNVTEGGYSVSWNMDAVKAWYNALCSELGVENVLFARPKIRNRSNLW